MRTLVLFWREQSHAGSHPQEVCALLLTSSETSLTNKEFRLAPTKSEVVVASPREIGAAVKDIGQAEGDCLVGFVCSKNPARGR
jgi:hypothetical protein